MSTYWRTIPAFDILGDKKTLMTNPDEPNKKSVLPEGNSSDQARQNSIKPKPLTKRWARGPRKGELYTRRLSVVLEIREALQLSPEALIDRIRRTRYNDIEDFRHPPQGFLKPETLVHLVRHHMEESEKAVEKGQNLTVLSHRRAVGAAWEAAMIIAIRIIRRNLQDLPYAAREKAEDEVLEIVSNLIPDTSPMGEYLEVSFGDILWKRTINARDRHLRSKDASEQKREEYEGEIETIAVDSSPDPSKDLEVKDLLEILPDPLREPFEKRVLEDVPITHSDPDELPLTDQLEVSGKTVGNRLRKAEDILAQTLSDDEKRYNERK